MATNNSTAGLQDVVAGTSNICFIDGDEGRLLYRGYNIHDLATHATFEEVCYLLWNGLLPTKAQLAELDAQLKANREIPAQVLQFITSAPNTSVPMEVLRTAVSMLALYDPEAHDMSHEANLRKAIRLTAQIPTIVTANARVRAGKAPIGPRNDLSLAKNFLYMMFGEEPKELSARFFDIALTLHADHELNASTFACRVTAGTLSDIYSSVVSGIGALKGPLHGGANEQVMRMLTEIGSTDKAQAWITAALAEKKKIMGFGHRVYHTEDPRATHLRRFSEELGKAEGETKWYEMSRIVEGVVKEQKNLNPNVDFYSASCYYVIGIPLEQFTPIFACSRISGWTAHILEQYSNNRLIRPRADYTGDTRARWIPMDQRG